MPWEYSESTGQLKHNGIYMGTGYSGAGHTLATGRNNPAMQGVRNHGPIPQGHWHIGASYLDPHRGQNTMSLTPVGHDALDRDGFLIHGNNKENDASTGCIILTPRLRQMIADSGDHDLEVVP